MVYTTPFSDPCGPAENVLVYTAGLPPNATAVPDGTVAAEALRRGGWEVVELGETRPTPQVMQDMMTRAASARLAVVMVLTQQEGSRALRRIFRSPHIMAVVVSDLKTVRGDSRFSRMWLAREQRWVIRDDPKGAGLMTVDPEPVSKTWAQWIGLWR